MNNDLETFKNAIEENAKFHHLIIKDELIFDCIKKCNKKEFINFLKSYVLKKFKSSIHKYASFHKISRINALLFAGVSINATNESGQTPLYNAL